MDDRPQARKRAPRRDAQRRREALLTAATICFQDHGYDVPLEVIADRAGVGRGTLYRNFKDREALALAIFSREIDRFEDTFDAAAPIQDNLVRMIRQASSAQALFRRIATDLRQDDANFPAFEALGHRLEAILTSPVRQARDRGEIDAAVSAADLVLVLQMMGGLIYPFLSDGEVADRISAALRLLLQGLRPR